MAELSLPQVTCLALRAQAHRLEPVVRLGAAGLSEAALREIDRALTAHGLVKVRAGKLEREERDAMFGSMAERLGAARVQVIGHTFVLFRPIPQRQAPAPRKAARAPATRVARDAKPANKAAKTARPAARRAR